MRADSTGVATVNPFEELVGGGGNVGKGNPGVFVRGETLPTHEILVTLTGLPAVENRGDRGRSGVGIIELEGVG